MKAGISILFPSFLSIFFFSPLPFFSYRRSNWWNGQNSIEKTETRKGRGKIYANSQFHSYVMFSSGSPVRISLSLFTALVGPPFSNANRSEVFYEFLSIEVRPRSIKSFIPLAFVFPCVPVERRASIPYRWLVLLNNELCTMLRILVSLMMEHRIRKVPKYSAFLNCKFWIVYVNC